MTNPNEHHFPYFQFIADGDVKQVKIKEREYNCSWKLRGGIGAFMMLARKWDRLENAVKTVNYDIFKAVEVDRREEGVIDDIRDLRRYLLLVEAELEARKQDQNLNIVTTPTTQRLVPRQTTGQEHPFGYDPREDDDAS